MNRSLCILALALGSLAEAAVAEAGCHHNPYHADCPYGGPCYACRGRSYSWGYPQGYDGHGSWGYAPTQWQNGFGYRGTKPCGFGPDFGRGYGYYPSWGPGYRNRFTINGGGYGGYDGGYGPEGPPPAVARRQ